MERDAVKLKEYSFEIGSIDDSSETVAIVGEEYSCVCIAMKNSIVRKMSINCLAKKIKKLGG